MDFKILQQEYNETQQKLALLAQRLESERAQCFLALPEQVGLPSIDKLIAALLPLASQELRGTVFSMFASSEEAVEKPAIAPKKRRRGKITSKIRDEIVLALKSKKFTALEIAKRFGISAGAVNIIKSQERLTKSRT